MFNTAPNEWTLRSLIDHCSDGPQSLNSEGQYEPARPYGLFSLKSRLRLAWLVFTGRADALRWPGNGPKAY